MDTNWYILYCRPGRERKVSTMIEKKKVKHFLPLAYLERTGIFRSKMVEEPLFPGYVFISSTESQLINLCDSLNELKVVYWKNEPAIIPESEIIKIKRFISNYDGIVAKRTNVKTTHINDSFNLASLIVDEEPLTLKNDFTQVVLPSLGYSLTAKTQRHTVTIIRENKAVEQN